MMSRGNNGMVFATAMIVGIALIVVTLMLAGVIG